MQNTTHAVMSQRNESRDSLDDFPTPPWATRALLTHILTDNFANLNCLEPACGRGYMARPLLERFSQIEASDIHNYGYGKVLNFLDSNYKENQFDWVITNPPFNLAEQFIYEAQKVSRIGVAILARTVFLESIGRYNRLFSRTPPNKIAQFSERVPMVRGRVDQKASTATGYAWFIWDKNLKTTESTVCWVPPCRKLLEKPEDYTAV